MAGGRGKGEGERELPHTALMQFPCMEVPSYLYPHPFFINKIPLMQKNI